MTHPSYSYVATIAPIHTLTNSQETVKISGSRLCGVTIKNAFGRTFESVNCIYYTVQNLVTGESATYAHIEVTPNTLRQRDVVPFLYGQLAWYTQNGWYVSYGDIIVDCVEV